jgi:LacI family transcriptional regulator
MASSVSVHDVAALAGVSIGTVSNVLNRPEKVAASTVVKVQLAIDRLGFVRNDAARQLRAGRSRAIGLIILDVANPFFTDVARGAQGQAAAAGMSVILGNSDENADRENDYLELFESQRVHGVLLSPFGEAAPRLLQLRKNGIPAVLVDRLSADSSFSSVSVDDVAGGAMAVQHLIDQGRKRIAFAGGPLAIRQISDRLHGASSAAASQANVTLEVIPLAALTADEGRRAGELIAARDSRARPDAVFAANDLVATGLLQAFLMNHSIAVPGDIAIVGYDDIGFARSAAVPLSSVRQPAALIGETSVDILLAEADDRGAPAQHVVFQPSLVVRESSS